MNYYAGYYYVDITNVKSGDYECKVIYYDNGSYEWYPDGMGNGLNFYVDDNSTVRIILNPHSREPYVEIYNPGETVPTFKPPVEPTNPTEKTEPVTNATEPIISYTEPTTIATETTYTYENSPKTTVQFNKSIATIYRKAQLQIKPIITNGRGKTTYKSSNSSVVKVNSSGKATGIKKGTATITVTNNNGSAKLKITVKNPKLNVSKKTITAGKSFKLKITGRVGTAKFSSSNKKIATVTKSGKVKGVKNGKTIINVKTNGITLKCKVTVQPNYTKYKGTWKNGNNKIVIKSVNGSKIKVYMYTKYAFGGRFADATTTGTIKNYSVKLYFTDSWLNDGVCTLKLKSNSISAKTKITYHEPSANASLYINGTFKKK